MDTLNGGLAHTGSTIRSFRTVETTSYTALNSAYPYQGKNVIEIVPDVLLDNWNQHSQLLEHKLYTNKQTLDFSFQWTDTKISMNKVPDDITLMLLFCCYCFLFVVACFVLFCFCRFVCFLLAASVFCIVVATVLLLLFLLPLLLSLLLLLCWLWYSWNTSLKLESHVLMTLRYDGIIWKEGQNNKDLREWKNEMKKEKK